MTKTTTKTQTQTKEVRTNDVKTILVFGHEIENKKLTNLELGNLIKQVFPKEKLEIGKLSYFILALKYLGLTDISYKTLVQFAHKYFEINGMQTNTTEKCMAHYMNKIKKGKIDITKEFKTSGRCQQVVDISEFGL